MMNSDIYRILVDAEGKGCSATLLNEFVSLKPGEEKEIPVYISFEKGSSRNAKVNLKIISESDPDRKLEMPLVFKSMKPGE